MLSPNLRVSLYIHSLSRRLVYPRPYRNVFEFAIRDGRTGSRAMDTILRKHDRSITASMLRAVSSYKRNGWMHTRDRNRTHVE